MSALRWSSGETSTWMPAEHSASSVAHWVTGTGSSRTSRAFAPALTMPLTIARLIMRDERA